MMAQPSQTIHSQPFTTCDGPCVDFSPFLSFSYCSGNGLGAPRDVIVPVMCLCLMSPAGRIILLVLCCCCCLRYGTGWHAQANPSLSVQGPSGEPIQNSRAFSTAVPPFMTGHTVAGPVDSPGSGLKLAKPSKAWFPIYVYCNNTSSRSC